MHVKDLVIPTGKWKWDLLQNLLPCSVFLQLAAVSPPREDKGADAPYWSLSSDENFSIKYAYYMLADISFLFVDNRWDLA